MKIAVIGLGFVGLMTALSFAEKGNEVLGFDTNCEKVATLSKGEMYFSEPGSENVLKESINNNFFVFSNIVPSIKECEVIFFCLPSDALSNGCVDLSAIKSVCHELHSVLPADAEPVIVIKSTVPPTTLNKQIRPLFLSLNRTNLARKLVSCPEFLREGVAWQDVKYPDRIVVGAEDDDAYMKMKTLYKAFGAPIIRVSPETAEFVKYLSNTLLATLISFSNEMAECADLFGNINTKKAFDILHMDKRLAGSGIASYVYPGCGYGGYCLPKDTKAFYNASSGRAKLLGETIRVNEERINYIVDYICNNTTEQDEILALGLTFKPDTDDIRESASVKIINELLKHNRKIVLYDPIANDKAKMIFEDRVSVTNVPTKKLHESDVVVLLTAWKEFLNYNFDNINLIDCRYIIDK